MFPLQECSNSNCENNYERRHFRSSPPVSTKQCRYNLRWNSQYSARKGYTGCTYSVFTLRSTMDQAPPGGLYYALIYLLVWSTLSEEWATNSPQIFLQVRITTEPGSSRPFPTKMSLQAARTRTEDAGYYEMPKIDFKAEIYGIIK